MKMLSKTLLLAAMMSLATLSVADPLTFSLNRLQDGKSVAVTEKSFDNKYLLIAVGYTGCPDICPTTMLDMRMLLANLDTQQLSDRIQPLFITIDPESDTLKDITDYGGFFDKRIVGLRASDFTALDDVVEQLRASYGYTFDGKPVFPPNLPKGYTVMHSIYLYLYSPDGELIDAYPYNIAAKTLSEKVATELKKNAEKIVSPKKVATCDMPKPFKRLDKEKVATFKAHSALKGHLTTENAVPHLINFWATWCAPCRQELPFLQTLSNEERAQIALVNIEDDPADAETVLEAVDVSLDTDYVKMELLDELGIQGLPASIVTHGDSLYLGVGVLKEEQAIRDWLACLQ